MNAEKQESPAIILFAFFGGFFYFKSSMYVFFVAIWKTIMLFFMLPLSLLPEKVTEILFFWVDANISSVSSSYVNALFKSPTYIIVNFIPIGFFGEISSFVGSILSPFIFLIMLFSMLLVSKRNSVDYRKIFNLDEFIEYQAKEYPQIKLIVNDNPVETDDLDEGKWAMNPMLFDYLMANKMLIEEKVEFEDTIHRLDVNQTRNILSTHLGRPWVSLQELEKEERYIMAILMLKSTRETKDSYKLVDLIAETMTTEMGYSNKRLKSIEKMVDDKIKEVFLKCESSIPFQTAISQHFYVNTVLARLLEDSRRDGVLASASFLWLKARNRRLWYLLNNVGRHSSWLIVSGAWCHLKLEKKLRRRIPKPYVDMAIIAIDADLINTMKTYIAIDDKKAFGAS